MPTRPSTPNELAVLDSALHAFRALGLKAVVRTTRKEDSQLQLQYGHKTIIRSAQVKRTVGKASLGTIAHQLAQIDAPLLVTEYVAPEVAERLRELNIQFVDTAGNAYLEDPPLLIWVTGRRPERPPIEARPTRAFQPGGLKLIFALLCNPALANTAYCNKWGQTRHNPRIAAISGGPYALSRLTQTDPINFFSHKLGLVQAGAGLAGRHGHRGLGEMRIAGHCGDECRGPCSRYRHSPGMARTRRHCDHSEFLLTAARLSELRKLSRS
jgi:hypothetical protein